MKGVASMANVKTTPRIIHIMQDGTVRDSVTGITIHNADFYTVLNSILKKRGKKKC